MRTQHHAPYVRLVMLALEPQFNLTNVLVVHMLLGPETLSVQLVWQVINAIHLQFYQLDAN